MRLLRTKVPKNRASTPERVAETAMRMAWKDGIPLLCEVHEVQLAWGHLMPHVVPSIPTIEAADVEPLSDWEYWLLSQYVGVAAMKEGAVVNADGRRLWLSMPASLDAVRSRRQNRSPDDGSYQPA